MVVKSSKAHKHTRILRRDVNRERRNCTFCQEGGGHISRSVQVRHQLNNAQTAWMAPLLFSKFIHRVKQGLVRKEIFSPVVALYRCLMSTVRDVQTRISSFVITIMPRNSNSEIPSQRTSSCKVCHTQFHFKV